MQIVISGLGKVGFYLVGELSGEGHDITVVDIKPEKVRNATSTYDVMGLSGNIVDPSVLEQIDMDQTDLFIAVTMNDEVNLLSCLFAKKAGCSRTIARVRSIEYAKNMEYLKSQLGVDMIINPEELTAKEIYDSLALPAAIEVDSFAYGSGEIYKIKVREGGVLDGMAVKDVHRRIHDNVLICIDERNGVVHIPDGNFVLKAKDILYLAGNRQEMIKFLFKAGIPNGTIRNLMIIGGGKIAPYLIDMMTKEKVNVTLIDQDPKVCEKFAVAFPKAIVVNGDATDAQLLEQEGLFEMDAVVTLTGFDEENVFISMYVNQKVGCKIITKVTRDFVGDILAQLNLDTLINPKRITAEYIVKYVRAIDNSLGNNVETIHRLANDRVEAVEFVIRHCDEVVGIPISELDLKPGVIIAFITRNGEMVLPRGNTMMQEGDLVVLITNTLGFMDIRDALVKSKKQSHLLRRKCS